MDAHDRANCAEGGDHRHRASGPQHPVRRSASDLWHSIPLWDVVTFDVRGKLKVLKSVLSSTTNCPNSASTWAVGTGPFRALVAPFENESGPFSDFPLLGIPTTL